MSAAKRYFDEKLDEDNSGDVDALEDWLATGIIKTTQDAITFWTGMQTSSHPLARMGLDYLSIPGMIYFLCICSNLFLSLATSTDAERSFSKGGLTVSKLRHSLSDESTRASTVLGSWTELEGAIPHAEIIKQFKAKSKRPKKKARIQENTDELETIVIDSN